MASLEFGAIITGLFSERTWMGIIQVDPGRRKAIGPATAILNRDERAKGCDQLREIQPTGT